ncbi:HAD family hydrolase [Membranihabitans maritimus]|uniref:HAD family hydrolase n=1 Tax=Membranihabitans maritimus TaxID=2904244 RepID=UPI001F24585E|nr:HAD family phosphatase [Membranihabitans maritimus]
MIKNIVFDLGGVLINWDPKLLYRKIFSTEDEVEYFLSSVCPYDWNLEQDRGRPLDQAAEERIELFPEYQLEIKAYYGRWSEMLDGGISENIQVLKYFRDNPEFKIYALTNWSQYTFPIAQEKFDFLKSFDGIIMSGEEKLIKPDPKIYKVLLRRYALQAEQCVFIDDRKENCIAAESLNFSSIHFTAEKSLASELEQLTNVSINS